MTRHRSSDSRGRPGVELDVRPIPARRAPRGARRILALGLGCVVPLGLLLGAWCGPVRAQEDVGDVLGGLGKAERVDEEAEAAAARAQQREGEGTLVGTVWDGDKGTPIQGATVIVRWPEPADGSQPRLEVQVTDSAGDYRFPSIPPGSYSISFSKSGYRPSTMTDFRIEAGQLNRADFPLPPKPTETGEEVMELEAFVVEASTVSEMMDSLELRMDSDLQLSIMSAEDFSKYAAGDVAEAMRRVAGVNIVEGQFAIIRGLEDRYSSTLYNTAPVPSPDPDRQSVQLDLFPSEIVQDVVVAKTFAPDLPGNSAGGSIDIVTLEFPEEGWFLKFKAAGGIDTNAKERFIQPEPSSPVGVEDDDLLPINDEFGGLIGGSKDIFGRNVRVKALVNWERGYDTAFGWVEGREPTILDASPCPPRGACSQQNGSLGFGEMPLSDGTFDLTTSGREEQLSAFGALGFDLDEAGHHKIDFTAFYTKKQQQVVQFRENGYFPEFDYSDVIQAQRDREEILPQDFNDVATNSAWIARTIRQDPGGFASRGPVWFSAFFESESFERTRDLLVTQLNGDHELESVEGLSFDWAANWARTTQQDGSFSTNYFYEPDLGQDEPDPLQRELKILERTNEILDALEADGFPSTVDLLGPGGVYAANNSMLISSNDVTESQFFLRGDGEYERSFASYLAMTFGAGFWWEQAERNVTATFLESPTVDGLSQFAITGDTPQEMGRSIIDGLDQRDGFPSFNRVNENESSREIHALHFDLKGTLWEDLDLFGGLRFENIVIESLNQPFTDTGDVRFPRDVDPPGSPPATFPELYLFFDRLDNDVPTNQGGRAEVAPGAAPDTFNDQLLNLDLPINPETGFVDFLNEAQILGIVNGRIDSNELMPSLGITYRPLDGLSLRGSWSQTVARPSFRELGFYVSVEPGSDDLIVGNPQLQLSHIESLDARAEYVYGDMGDLAAFSVFYKTIDDPIESIVIRNPLNAEQASSALYRTFFNNPNRAQLWGIELEARKSFDFIPLEMARYLSIGGNFTYIDAEVERTQLEIGRAQPFFDVLEGETPLFLGLPPTRRLFGQPEWIANANISFDHPDWGTRLTLAFFAISDVLDAAGSTVLLPNNNALSYTPDRYIDSFMTLDLIASQRIPLGPVGEMTLQFTAKNLTNSWRSISYDGAITAEQLTERAFQVGRSYKLSLGYAF
jgi:TonB-dependent receptor